MACCGDAAAAPFPREQASCSLARRKASAAFASASARSAQPRRWIEVGCDQRSILCAVTRPFALASAPRSRTHAARAVETVRGGARMHAARARVHA